MGGGTEGIGSRRRKWRRRWGRRRRT